MSMWSTGLNVNVGLGAGCQCGLRVECQCGLRVLNARHDEIVEEDDKG